TFERILPFVDAEFECNSIAPRHRFNSERFDAVPVDEERSPIRQGDGCAFNERVELLLGEQGYEPRWNGLPRHAHDKITDGQDQQHTQQEYEPALAHVIPPWMELVVRHLSHAAHHHSRIDVQREAGPDLDDGRDFVRDESQGWGLT